MKKFRMEQVDEYMRHEIAQFLSQNNNPEYLITVTAVETSRDLNNANVFISAINYQKKQVVENEIIKTLNLLKPDLQKYLLDRLDFRKIPEIHFRLDHTAENAQKIEKIIDNL